MTLTVRVDPAGSRWTARVYDIVTGATVWRSPAAVASFRDALRAAGAALRTIEAPRPPGNGLREYLEGGRTPVPQVALEPALDLPAAVAARARTAGPARQATGRARR